MKTQYKTEIKNLLETLNTIVEKKKIDYKMVYEYRFDHKYKYMKTNRRIVIFENNSPADSFYFNNDIEVMEFILKELAFHCPGEK